MPEVAPGLWERILKALDVENPSQAARKLGLAKQSVYEWKGGKVPGLATLIQIAESGNTSLDWLVRDRDGEAGSGALEGNSRAIVDKLARLQGKTPQEMLNLMVREAIARRGEALFSRYPEMEVEDVEEMRVLLTLFDDELRGSATSSEASRRRG